MALRAVTAFEDEWPQLARRLGAFLARKGVPADARDDLVQETGLRLFQMWQRVDRTRDVWPLVLTISLNLLYDNGSKARREVPGDVPESMTHQDVEHAVLARLDLSKVARSLMRLRPSYRSALLAELAEDANVRADKVVRFRARRALKQLIEDASARSLVALGALRRALREWPSRAVSHVAAPEAFGSTVAASLIVAASWIPATSSETVVGTTPRRSSQAAVGWTDIKPWHRTPSAGPSAVLARAPLPVSARVAFIPVLEPVALPPVAQGQDHEAALTEPQSQLDPAVAQL